MIAVLRRADGRRALRGTGVLAVLGTLVPVTVWIDHPHRERDECGSA